MNVTAAELNEIALNVAEDVITEYNGFGGHDIVELSRHLEDALEANLEDRIMQCAEAYELEKPEVPLIADAIKGRLSIIFDFVHVTIDTAAACKALMRRQEEALKPAPAAA